MSELTMKTGIKRGLRRHCPHCDSPTLFSGYLKVRPRCPVCGADNSQHRVDDIASYFTVLSDVRRFGIFNLPVAIDVG